MKKQVELNQTEGTVYIKRNGEKQKVEARAPENEEDLEKDLVVPIKDGDTIITGEDSYAIDISDENTDHYTYVSLFPNSKAKLNIKGATITKVTLMDGLFRVRTYGPISLPLAEIEYLVDSDHFFWIHVKDEEKVSVALVSGYAEITHKDLGKSTKIMMNQQVTLTPSSISEKPEEVDQKLKDAYKKQRDFESNYWAMTEGMSKQFEEGYVEMMQKNVVQLEKDIKELEEEGEIVPKMLRTQLKQFKRELRKAKQEVKENREYRKQKKEAEKEATEFQKKFEKREAKFAQDLENMAQEVSKDDRSQESQGGGEELTDLEKQIQAAGSDTDTSEATPSENEDLSELEKQIQAAGEGTQTDESETSEEEGEEDEDLSELEKKIRDAG
ncbi:MAG: hypothetical protein R6U96_04255 [Promethearchaeia archaeon]